ncbi:T9SS type A sorting domain-containing protein [Hymenobacter gummosus]|uniref:T9SS type A sorting domain-containing protein n=1 Tax=Hymenobacter gummosus TaxID=1776032 RepID=A0A3S0QF65_9BACT|nr:T9SS type A sorting domain-containing protein [Hymenobacter gummosus]RTQ46226.1 T9SS type A sorting domain-containing protein [Hymenobacter gummosus]
MKTPSWLRALALAAAILPAAPSFSLAQAGPDSQAPRAAFGHHGRDGHHKGNGELRAYVQQNVMPVLRQQRQKLEAQLSAADKTQLSAYRSQLKALREQGQTLRKALRPAEGSTPGQRPQLTDAQKQQLEKLHSEKRTVLQGVAQLAQKYDAQIQQLKAEVQPQRDKWAADLQALAQKNRTPEQQQQLEQRKAAGKHHGRGQHGFGTKNFFGATRFLLMDPNAPAQPAVTEAGRPAAMYPNPATSTQRLDYEVKKEGNVKVELLDERGKTVRTVFEGRQDKGSHSLDVNLAELGRGTYYYKITSKGGSETRRFVKE